MTMIAKQLSLRILHTTLTPFLVPTTLTPPHANTHFNHLDFHYHSFLFSLLNLVLLTTEP